jgi:CheY-like chemotaxis protein
MMDLTCLLLTGDGALLKLVRESLGAANVRLEVRTDAASAIELARRRHIDGFVIDCDDVHLATDALIAIRNSRSNKLSVIFAVLNGKTSIDAAVEAGANFVLAKPVRETLLRNHLEVAIPKMEREHRRYFRHKIDLPIAVTCAGETSEGKIMNVSEGGVALTHHGLDAAEGMVTVQFELPGVTAQIFRARSEVVWRDASTIGVRFLRIEAGSRRSFEAWLESLEGQLLLRESIQPSNANV